MGQLNKIYLNLVYSLLPMKDYVFLKGIVVNYSKTTIRAKLIRLFEFVHMKFHSTDTPRSILKNKK